MKSKEYHGILRCIIPQYDELTLFAMSFTCGLLLLVGALSSKWEIQMVPFSEGDFAISIIILFFLAGLILSLYHAFTDRLKTSLEKYLMLFFAVILNAFTGIWAGTYFLDGVTGWLVIFPIANIISGGSLLVMFRSGALDEHNVSDQNVSRGQVALAAVAVVALFFVCHYMFDLVWAQTLSICVAYATNLNRGVQTLFSRMILKHHPTKEPGRSIQD